MITTYKILSLLLSYPGSDLQEFLPEAQQEAGKDGLLSNAMLERLREFTQHFSGTDLIEWQARYVQLFDNSKSVSLYLFEHLKGDSRDRGQAMIDLQEFYRENGLEPSGAELPDYLPVFLEFLSTLSVEKAAELLSWPVNIIHRIYTCLEKKQDTYQHLFKAIISLSAHEPCNKTTQSVILNEIQPDFDADYEKHMIFGSDNSCFTCK
jgi:nitrate reductase delta subunit